MRQCAGELIQQVSVDEAYVDVSSQAQTVSPDASLECALPLARALKELIRQDRKLSASTRIATNKLLAIVNAG